MSDVMEILKRGDNSLEALLRAVLLDSENKVPSERLRIVGALSAGAIIEQGSNANGEYIKLAGGTQIAYATAPISGNFDTTISDPWHMAYTSTITYPASFIQAPIVAGSVITPEAYSLVCRIVPSTTGFYVLLLAMATVAFSSNARCGYIAVGRWKA